MMMKYLNHADNEMLSSLLGEKKPYGISLFLPLEQAEGRVRQGERNPAFTHQVLTLKKQLKAYGVSDGEMTEILNRLEKAKGTNTGTDRNYKGQVVFISGEQTLHFALPISVEAFSHVGNHYYVKPLLALPREDTRFLLLQLELHKVRLFEGNQFEMAPLKLAEDLPQYVEEVVGKDYKEKVLQSRQGHNAQGTAIYHGHGEGKDDRKLEIEKFCREVSKAIDPVIKDTSLPLIVDSVPYVFDIFKSVHHAPLLLKMPSEFHGKESQPEYRSEAFQLVQASTSRASQRKLQAYQEQNHTDKTSEKLSALIEAAQNGRIDTVFIRKGKEIWANMGAFIKDKTLNKEAWADLIGHYDWIARKTLEKGGDVFVLEAPEFPAEAGEICGLFRY